MGEKRARERERMKQQQTLESKCQSLEGGGGRKRERWEIRERDGREKERQRHTQREGRKRQQSLEPKSQRLVAENGPGGGGGGVQEEREIGKEEMGG